MSGRVRLGAFLAAGLVVALALAVFVGPRASGEPDGLERVAIDHGFAETADDHALADLPTADYGERGMGAGAAGAIGVAITLAATGGLLWLVRRRA
jgi:hypothetical protein